MALVPIREIGKMGVNTDTDSLLLPPNVWTMAVNARFEGNGITRGPVFKRCGPLVLNTSPRYVVSYKQLLDSGINVYLIHNENGTITRWAAVGAPGSASTETDVTTSGWTPVNYPGATTATFLNNVVYSLRADRVPWYMVADGTQFATLPNWDANWRARSIRNLAGVVVALNLTKSGISYPTMVKTSDYTTFGAVPGSWTASTTNSATENVISDLPEALVDGVVLRDTMVLYSLNYTYLMSPTFDNNMFSYRRLFVKAGMISQNCGVEIDNIHYVFGADDIWKHDGTTRTSVADSRVRSFIYENMVRSESWQFFTTHNRKLNEVSFNYVSTDPYCAFPVAPNNYQGCNRSAVYNYKSDAWYFYDLPYVRSSGEGAGGVSQTWTSIDPVIWVNLSGSWSSLTAPSLNSTLTVNPLVLGAGIGGADLSAAVRSFERQGSNYDVGVVAPAANAPVYLENQYIDMDGVFPEIRGYKLINSIYPNARFVDPTTSLTFNLAGADYASSPDPNYGAPMIYDGGTNYKLDYLNQGRYMSIKVTYTALTDFLMSGIDINIQNLGHR